MTAAHTPGPWKAHFEEAYFVTGPDLGRVAMMQNLKGAHGLGGRRSGAEAAANNRLIAAAPELLAALQAFCSMCDEDKILCLNEDRTELIESLTAANAAVAKATGAA